MVPGGALTNVLVVMNVGVKVSTTAVVSPGVRGLDWVAEKAL